MDAVEFALMMIVFSGLTVLCWFGIAVGRTVLLWFAGRRAARRRVDRILALIERQRQVHGR